LFFCPCTFVDILIYVSPPLSMPTMKRAAFWLGRGGYGHGFSAIIIFFLIF